MTLAGPEARSSSSLLIYQSLLGGLTHTTAAQRALYLTAGVPGIRCVLQVKTQAHCPWPPLPPQESGSDSKETKRGNTTVFSYFTYLRTKTSTGTRVKWTILKVKNHQSHHENRHSLNCRLNRDSLSNALSKWDHLLNDDLMWNHNSSYRYSRLLPQSMSTREKRLHPGSRLATPGVQFVNLALTLRRTVCVKAKIFPKHQS